MLYNCVQPGGDCSDSAGFMRDDALFAGIIVSDEPDQSALKPDAYVDYFWSLKEDPDLMKIHAIAGAVPVPTCTTCASAGFGYDVAVDLTGARSSTSADVSGLSALAESSIESLLFKLSGDPVEDTIGSTSTTPAYMAGGTEYEEDLGNNAVKFQVDTSRGSQFASSTSSARVRRLIVRVDQERGSRRVKVERDRHAGTRSRAGAQWSGTREEQRGPSLGVVVPRPMALSRVGFRNSIIRHVLGRAADRGDRYVEHARPVLREMVVRRVEAAGPEHVGPVAPELELDAGPVLVVLAQRQATEGEHLVEDPGDVLALDGLESIPRVPRVPVASADARVPRLEREHFAEQGLAVGVEPCHDRRKEREREQLRGRERIAHRGFPIRSPRWRQTRVVSTVLGTCR
jgi:hypothetical protein